MGQSTDDKDLQGEGNYDATRRYDKAAREFVRSGKVKEAARAAQPRSPAEAEEMKRAEEIGKSHAKGEGSQTPASETPARPAPAPKK